MTPGLEQGRRTVAEMATCSSRWAGTPTGNRCTTPTVVDESVYGPRPFREYTEDELQFMRANGISPDFARVAQAVRDMPLQELVAAPQELRAAEFLNPHDQTEMWIPLVNAVGLAETALNRRLVPVVEARFSYYHHAVLKPELAERGVLAHTAMLDAAFKHIHDGTAYVLDSVLKCPAARAVFADVVARYGIWSGRREYCIVLLGCIAYATALTTGDIIRWANGKEPFAPTGDASLVGIV